MIPQPWSLPGSLAAMVALADGISPPRLHYRVGQALGNRLATGYHLESCHHPGLPMPSNNLRPGLRASTEIVVGTRDTAHHVGSGKIKVLATPVMVMLLEEAALNAVEGLLSPGFQTVGTHLDISHIAATPVGMRVKACAEVTAIAGRRLTFRVWADDEIERIGEGTHERIIVEVERFDKRTRAKSGKNVQELPGAEQG